MIQQSVVGPYLDLHGWHAVMAGGRHFHIPRVVSPSPVALPNDRDHFIVHSIQEHAPQRSWVVLVSKLQVVSDTRAMANCSHEEQHIIAVRLLSNAVVSLTA